MMARAAKPYVLLRPPASSIPLLVVADQLPPDDMRGEYEAWRQTASVITTDALTPHVEEELANYGGFPDVDETLELKWIAAAARTPVALYAMETFGGVTEFEWAWLFDGAGSDRVLVHQSRGRAARGRGASGHVGAERILRAAHARVQLGRVSRAPFNVGR